MVDGTSTVGLLSNPTVASRGVSAGSTPHADLASELFRCTSIINLWTSSRKCDKKHAELCSKVGVISPPVVPGHVASSMYATCRGFDGPFAVLVGEGLYL